MPYTKADIQKLIDEMHKTMKDHPEKLIENLADDAKFMFPHYDAVVGKEAILKFQKMKKEKDPKGDMEVKMTVEDVIDSGDLVVVDGRAVATCTGKEIDNGKFLKIFRKDGSNLKVIRTMWNTSKPKDG